MGSPVDIDSTVERIVSLVPSLTEAVAATHRESLIGVTDWCTHPADLNVTRVRGTKNPDWRAIVALEPDLVVANKEENRELDVQRLRDAGVQVWVTVIETVPQALASMDRLFTEALHWPVPDWLIEARRLWSGPAPEARAKVAVPIWRDPWMVVGSPTYTSDLLRTWDSMRSTVLTSTGFSFPTSHTHSPPMTAPRHSTTSEPSSSVGACSPGMGPPWSKQPSRSTPRPVRPPETERLRQRPLIDAPMPDGVVKLGAGFCADPCAFNAPRTRRTA